jgi:NADH-quinone oxidoreductase subunit L
MAIPLVVLAIGAIVAGYVGVPHALGGANRIETFLEPSFEVRLKPDAATDHDPGHAADPAAHDETSLELTLMAVSTAVGLTGIGVAAFFFLRRRDRAEALARRLPGVHRLLLNKYGVDELYDRAIVQPIKRLSAGLLWRGVDAGLVDGAVNGVGAFVRGASGAMRRLQTGSVRAYAASLFFGVVVILRYFLWR